MRFHLTYISFALLTAIVPQAAPTSNKPSPPSITQNVQPAEVQPYDNDAGYAVLSVLLGGDPAKPSAASTAIYENTGSYSCRSDNKSPDEFREALKDYTSANKTRWRLQKKLGLNHPYTLVSDQEVNNAGGLRQYGNAHPEIRGIISVSAVGFNADKTVALVFQSFHCGPLCGEGELVAFRKINGQWKRVPSSPIRCGWIS
jgi:hypothetical protein